MKFLTNTFFYNSEYQHGNKYYFTRADSPEILAKIRRTKDETWFYWDKDIEYTVNSDLYRNPFEFSDVDWSNAIVLYGCSRTMGAGLDDFDTIRSQLSQYTDKQVVNMGSAGTSMAWSFHNSCIQGTYYPTPWAVINLWTSIYRIVEYTSEPGGQNNLGPWHVARPGDLFDKYTQHEINPIRWAQFYSMSSALMWNNCKYLEYSGFDETAQALNCKLLPTIDLARDDSHPGRESVKLTTQIIAQDLGLI